MASRHAFNPGVFRLFGQLRAVLFASLAGLSLAGCETGVSEQAGLASASSQDSHRQVADRPNILWIVAEDVSPWMSAYGDDTVSTPTLDAMASEGVVFLNAFSPNPICSPTRSALMTGRWPTSDGVHNHRRSRDPEGRDAINLPEGHLTLPEVFRANGYKTFNIGKDDYNFVYDRESLYNAGPAGSAGYLGAMKGPDFDWTQLAEGGPFFGQIQLSGGKGGASELVELNSDELQLPPYYPDIPTLRSEFEGHYQNIVKTDGEIAEILAALEATGEADNTVVFFFADHGMLMLRHKQFVYDGGVHVPVFIRYPEGAELIRRQGARRGQLISLIDLSAASLELAGISVPDHFEARGLFSEDVQPRSFVPLSRDRGDYTFDHIRAIRTERFKYIRNRYPDVPYMQPAYRDKRPSTLAYKELFARGELNAVQARFAQPTRPAEELYDLSSDPHEIRNLTDDPAFAEIKADLSARLDQWILDTGDQGQIEETGEEIGAVVTRWGQKCVDRRCVEYRRANEE